MKTFILYLLFALSLPARSAEGEDAVFYISKTRDLLIEYIVRHGGSQQNLRQDTDDRLLDQFLDLLHAPSAEGAKKRNVWITDIDDTVIEPRYLFTSISYRRTKINQTRRGIEEAHPGASSEEIHRLLAKDFWDFALLHPEIKPVDPLYLKLIKRFQERGDTVFALTARPKAMSAFTGGQLAQFGIEFGVNWPSAQLLERLSIYLSPETNGVFFSERDLSKNETTKGIALPQIIDGLFYGLPSGEALGDVFYVDDRRSEVFAVLPMKAQIENRLARHSQFWLVQSLVAENHLRTRGYFDRLAEIGALQEAVFRQTGVKIEDEKAKDLVLQGLRETCAVDLGS